MFTLDSDTVADNYTKLFDLITEYITGPRAEKLKQFYTDFGERLAFLPASTKPNYHNAIPGGYVDHVLRVVDNTLSMYDLYIEKGMCVSGFTKEELVFVAINHDLGKLGFQGEGNEGYLMQTDDWRKANLKEHYTNNPDIPFCKVPDRGLFLLQEAGIQTSWNEYLGIRIHDGIFDDANRPYYITRQESSKLKTNLPYIVWFADMMAATFEYNRYRDSIKINQPIPQSPQSREKVSVDDLLSF